MSWAIGRREVLGGTIRRLLLPSRGRKCRATRWRMSLRGIGLSFATRERSFTDIPSRVAGQRKDRYPDSRRSDVRLMIPSTTRATRVTIPFFARRCVLLRMGGVQSPYFKMLTARATTSPRRARDAMAWTAITSLAQCLSGMTSVGLNAVALVKPR